MIRHEYNTTTIRFYATESDDPFETYTGICTVVWESPVVIWDKGMCGTITRANLREFLKFCTDNNIEVVKAHRASGRTLPFMVHVGDHMELSVSAATLASRTQENAR